MPTRYLLRGSLDAYIADQDYFDPPTGTFISGLSCVAGNQQLPAVADVPSTSAGKTLLKDLYDIDDNKWLMLLAGLGFAVLFRLQHYALMYKNLRKLGAALSTADTGQSANTSSSVHKVRDSGIAVVPALVLTLCT
jgi:hypothetical protein